MKKLIILLTSLIFLSSCSVNKKPEFLRIENIKVLETTSKHVTLTANALFKNPNDIGGQLKTDEIKVFINGNEMANVSTENFKVPANKEFSIPLKANISADRLFKSKNISGLIGSLLSKKMEVQYKGQIKYKVLGFSHTYDIDKTENLKIKL